MCASLAFDTDILLDNNKREKVLIDLNIDGKKQTKSISTKILKTDEHNQYGQAMTKSLLYGCIKRQEQPPSLVEFNKILDKISHDNNIGHLFIVHIKFHDVNPNILLFNELYPQSLKKKTKKLESLERSTFQLMSIMRRD